MGAAPPGRGAATTATSGGGSGARRGRRRVTRVVARAGRRAAPTRAPPAAGAATKAGSVGAMAAAEAGERRRKTSRNKRWGCREAGGEEVVGISWREAERGGGSGNKGVVDGATPRVVCQTCRRRLAQTPQPRRGRPHVAGRHRAVGGAQHRRWAWWGAVEVVEAAATASRRLQRPGHDARDDNPGAEAMQSRRRHSPAGGGGGGGIRGGAPPSPRRAAAAHEESGAPPSTRRRHPPPPPSSRPQMERICRPFIVQSSSRRALENGRPRAAALGKGFVVVVGGRPTQNCSGRGTRGTHTN